MWKWSCWYLKFWWQPGLSQNSEWTFVCLPVCDSSEESSLGIDHAEEMELLLENYYMQVGLAKILIYCKIIHLPL